MSHSVIFDPEKAAANLAKHGLSFSDVESLDWDFAMIEEDTASVDEQRFAAIGPMGALLVAMIYTVQGDLIRVISLRRATAQELKDWKNEYQT